MQYRIGIDLGGTNIKAGVVDPDYRILCEKNIPTCARRSAQEVMNDMVLLVRGLMQDHALCEDRIDGVGIGSPGMIDAKTGTVVYSNNLNWKNVPLGQTLSGALGLPVRVSNDANCAALGEVKAGAACLYKNCVLITLGTGIGGGVVIDGKIFEGAHSGGTELGHTSLIAGGELCTCGRRGCLEAYASATALIRDTRRAAQADRDSALWELCGHDLERISGKTAFDAAKAGDAAAGRVIRNYIGYLGEGLVNMINIFRPDIVLLSGGVSNQREYLTRPLQKYVERYCFAKEKGFIPEIAVAGLENSAGIIGAAALVETLTETQKDLS